MRDVLPLFTLRCFERWPLESVFARALEANRGSTRVLERSGYRFEGRLRAELAGEPQMRTYRVWRSDYLGLGAAPTRRVRADVPLGTGGATASG